jgi:hypothetical protein
MVAPRESGSESVWVVRYARPVEGTPAAVTDPATWLTEQVDLPDAVEVTLVDASTHILLLPAEVSAQRAVGILIGTREPAEGDPWPLGEWLETETACWIRRSAIVSVRIVTRPKTTTA